MVLIFPLFNVMTSSVDEDSVLMFARKMKGLFLIFLFFVIVLLGLPIHRSSFATLCHPQYLRAPLSMICVKFLNLVVLVDGG